MKAHVQKWGNSLAVRIPKALAAEMHLRAASEVEVSLDDGRLVIEPETHRRWSLEELLSQVTSESLHGEVATGPAVGAEDW